MRVKRIIRTKDLASMAGYLASIALLFLVLLDVVALSWLSGLAWLYFVLSAVSIAAVGGDR